MKKSNSFLTAFLVSGAMILWYNISDQLTAMHQDNIGLVLLQSVMVIKFVCGAVVILPLEANFRQVFTGCLAADLYFGLLAANSAEVMIAQAILALFFLLRESRVNEDSRFFMNGTLKSRVFNVIAYDLANE